MKKILALLLLGQSVLRAAASTAPDTPLRKGGYATLLCRLIDGSETSLGNALYRIEEKEADLFKGRSETPQYTPYRYIFGSGRTDATKLRKRGSRERKKLVQKIREAAHKRVLAQAKGFVRSNKDMLEEPCSYCDVDFTVARPGVMIYDAGFKRVHPICAKRCKRHVIGKMGDIGVKVVEVKKPFYVEPRSPKTPSRVRAAAVQARYNIQDSREESDRAAQSFESPVRT